MGRNKKELTTNMTKLFTATTFFCLAVNASKLADCYWAGEGDNCEGWDESTSSYFPDCEPGLECKSIGAGMISIPGTEKTCQKSILNEVCEGYNESTGMPYADCVDGLECRYTEGMMSIPGAGKTCQLPLA